MSDSDIQRLVERIEGGERSNELDLLVELALFKPTKNWPSARANSARTKIIYVAKDGSEETCWPREWEHYPDVIAALRTRITERTDDE